MTAGDGVTDDEAVTGASGFTGDEVFGDEKQELRETMVRRKSGITIFMERKKEITDGPLYGTHHKRQIEHHLETGSKISNERGTKTRTGKAWGASTVRNLIVWNGRTE